jgi:hypothetical protein
VGQRINQLITKQPISTVGSLVAEKNEQDFNPVRCVNRLEDDPVPAGHLPVAAFEFLALEGPYQSPKGILFKFQDVVENSLSAIRRNGLKLFYGFVREVYGPVHL